MDRNEEVWARLARVTDPELDESVTELGFVKSVAVDNSDVRVLFHLPTFWCAANFAYMMAYDMYHAVNSLTWVDSVEVKLLEHMYADTINQGIKERLSFQDTFGAEATDEIDTVRALFRRKAFQQRQELLLRQMIEWGVSKRELVNITIGDLLTLLSTYANQEADQNSVEQNQDEKKIVQRYLEIRQEWGGPADATALAMVKVNGEKLDENKFDEYLHELRSTRINTQFNGEICKGLLRARYGAEQQSQNGSANEFTVQFHPLTELRSNQ